MNDEPTFDVAREVWVCVCATDVPPFASDLQFRVQDEGDLRLVGARDGVPVTWTFLSFAREVDYPLMPGLRLRLRDDVAYGYGAWTEPAERGRGWRRQAFAVELRLLHERGYRWEASVFAAAQLAPATRSLAGVGIVVEPLWRVTYTRARRSAFERLTDDDRVTCL